MARSSYLRALIGRPPESASLLRPPRVSPWARRSFMESFGQPPGAAGGEALVSASESAGESTIATASARTPAPLHPASELAVNESRSRTLPVMRAPATASLGPSLAFAPAPAAVQAERSQAMNPVGANTPHTYRQDKNEDAAESTMRGVSIARKQAPVNVTATGLNSTVPAGINQVETQSATQAHIPLLPAEPAGSPRTTLPERSTTRIAATEWKGKLWAREDEAFESAGNPSRPPLPRMPMAADAWQAPKAKVEVEGKGNSVHIGAIEIHVTSAPAPAPRHYAQSAAAGSGALSRVLTSPFGFNQI